jgi:hypothetical protein
VRITRSTPLGAVIARGRRAAAAPFGGSGGRAEAPCEFNVVLQTEILEGSREVTVTPQADCSLVLERIDDVRVVEPQDVKVAQQERPSPRSWLASIWQHFFPSVSAQTLWVDRSMYHHIYTCGVACAGGIDGLTALQSFLRYSHNTDFPRQVRLSNQTFEWYCMAGVRWTPIGTLSNCQPVLEVAGAPMFPGNTGWRVYNPWITGRVWGPNTTQVYASAQAEYDWNPSGASTPRFYWHRLIVESVGRTYPLAPLCNSILQGAPVAGPLRSACVVPGPTPLPY